MTSEQIALLLDSEGVAVAPACAAVQFYAEQITSATLERYTDDRTALVAALVEDLHDITRHNWESVIIERHDMSASGLIVSDGGAVEKK